MAQVVDSSNLVELVTTGKVPEFKPPEAPKPDAKPAESTSAEAKTDPGAQDTAAKADKPAGEQVRDEKTGQFVKKDDAAKAATTDDDDDADLPERVRKQIGKKHRRMMEAEEFARERDQAAVRERARAEAAERELERLRGGKSGGPSSEKQEGSDPDEPKPDDFKTVGEYTRALTKYHVDKAATNARTQAAQNRQQEQANAVIAAHVERQDKFRESTPDYDEVIEAASKVETPHLVVQYLVESDVGPQLAYHLAKNPDEISRLSKLSPSRQLAELGKLEAKLEAKPAPAANGNGAKLAASEVSRAPAPIQPLDAKTTPVQKDPSQMTVSELRAFRQQEARAKAAR